MHDLALGRRHRFQQHALAGGGLLGRAQRNPFESHAAPLAVAGSVDRHRFACAGTKGRRVCDVLQRVDRLAVLARLKSLAR